MIGFPQSVDKVVSAITTGMVGRMYAKKLQNKSFAQAFSKACEVQRQSLCSRSAEREISFFLPTHQEGFPYTFNFPYITGKIRKHRMYRGFPPTFSIEDMFMEINKRSVCRWECCGGCRRCCFFTGWIGIRWDIYAGMLR